MATSSSQPLPPVRVLLVDDEEDIYFLLNASLRSGHRRTYNVTWQPDFDSGLKTLKDTTFDVVLLDYYLGDKTGLDLLKSATNQGCSAPFILLTNSEEGGIDIQALKLGAMDYLSKENFSQETLERAIEYAMERKDLMRRLERERNQYASISKDFGEFVRVVGYDVLPQVEQIEEKVALIKPHLKESTAEIACQDILGETKKISNLVKSFLALDLANNS